MGTIKGDSLLFHCGDIQYSTVSKCDNHTIIWVWVTGQRVPVWWLSFMLFQAVTLNWPEGWNPGLILLP